jgi:HK97 family phage major capsid protein
MTIAQLEANLRAKKAEAKTLIEATMRAAQDHVVTPATATAAAVTGRLWTDEEKGKIQALLTEAKDLQARIDQTRGQDTMVAEFERLTAGMLNEGAAGQNGDRGGAARGRSLGQQFIADATFQKFIKGQGHRQSGAWTSPAVEVFGDGGPLTMHATTLDTSVGSGGPLIQPDVQPGFVPLMQRRLVVADLIAPGTTMGNLIQYMKEKTFTNAAASVAEAGVKPESTLVFEAATSPVQKIAHWIPVTDEMLEDFAQTQSIIDARLRLGVDLTEEDQLLNGNGTPPQLRGLMNLVGLAAAVARGADTNMDAIFKQVSAIATNALITPDGFVMNPANWLTIQLAKNAQGNYLGSGPWAPAQAPTLWGLPGAITPAIVANTALVGAYRSSAQIFRKGGVRVEATNSHSDFFVKNLTAIRAEERLALAVYRDAAFGKVTGLN